MPKRDYEALALKQLTNAANNLTMQNSETGYSQKRASLRDLIQQAVKAYEYGSAFPTHDFAAGFDEDIIEAENHGENDE